MNYAAPGGYDFGEARSFVEFCVELDNQDDRLQHPDDPRFRARIDPSQWTSIFDSRRAVAEDYMAFQSRLQSNDRAASGLSDDALSPWRRLFTEIDKEAARRRITIRTAEDVACNPDLNGFGPWQNAWVLYRGVGSNSGKFAIAIRGTVFSNTPSAIEDAIFQPVLGHRFLSAATSFALHDSVQLHSGFAHATFTLLLDRRYGVLPRLRDHQVPPSSELYIAGHSQGAAMATLVHAFLCTCMMQADTSSEDPLALRGLGYRLKSYAIAQPKPGNYAFSAQFAQYTQAPDIAIVINNSIDPVPQVPMTLEATADLATDFHGRFLLATILRSLSWPGKAMRAGVSRVLDWITRKSALRYGDFYRWEAIRPVRSIRAGSSWNFVPAGRVLLVHGTPLADPGSDVFFQHHASTYRDLIQQQLGHGIAMH
jgi:lipase (class 3)